MLRRSAVAMDRSASRAGPSLLTRPGKSGQL